MTVDSRQKLVITCLYYLSEGRKAFGPTGALAIQDLMDSHCSHGNYHEEVDDDCCTANPLYPPLWVNTRSIVDLLTCAEAVGWLFLVVWIDAEG